MHKIFESHNLPGNERTLDIILIPSNHRASILTTWMDPQSFWLQEMINDVGVAANVWLYDYQEVHGTSEEHTAWLDEGENFLQAMNVLPPTSSGRAQILFITHSLGGFVLKSALGKASNQQLWNLFPLIKGIVFLSSPHLKRHHVSSRDAFDRLILIGKTFTPPMATITLTNHEMYQMIWMCDLFEQLVVLTCPIVNTVEDVITPLTFRGILWIKQKPKKILVDSDLGAIPQRQNTLNIPVKGKTHPDTCRLDPNDHAYHEIKRLLS